MLYLAPRLYLTLFFSSDDLLEIQILNRSQKNCVSSLRSLRFVKRLEYISYLRKTKRNIETLISLLIYSSMYIHKGHASVLVSTSIVQFHTQRIQSQFFALSHWVAIDNTVPRNRSTIILFSISETV